MKAIFHLASPLVAVLIALSPASAVIDPNAPIVEVQTSCTGKDNCFTTMAALTSWIAATRTPAAADPLLVNVGPGEFDAFLCGITSIVPMSSKEFDHTTIRGSGRDQTRLLPYPDPSFGPLYGAGAANCDHLTFEALTITGGAYGAFWRGSGDSTWVNVHVESEGIGWYDFSCSAPFTASTQKHTWFASTILAKGNVGYVAECGTNFLYGSDIVVRGQAEPEIPPTWISGVTVSSWGVVRLFGSAIWVDTKQMSPTATLADGYGARVAFSFNGPHSGGIFEMHGGLIDVDTSGVNGADAVGIETPAAATKARTNDTAFQLKAGGGGTPGTPRRVLGNKAESPFLWGAGTERPLAGALRSEKGYDLFVETDCTSSGNCSSGGGAETHLMIYDERCTGDPWFDAVTGRCRNVP